MRVAVSSLSFTGPRINKMAQLPADFGIEIFYEWGSQHYWENLLEQIMPGRTGRFSIHSPFGHMDVSTATDEAKLFDQLRTPFDLYHKYNGECYVVHSCGHLDFPPDPVREEECRKQALDRLVRFDDICRREGVQMVVENLGFNNVERVLFNQQQFLDLFAQAPQLRCLLDTGHAVLADYDIYEIQNTLKDRLVAYHLHDNDGTADQHLRLGQGVIDWERFAQGFCSFTPDACVVMEYNAGEAPDYIQDREQLSRLIGL